MNFKINNNKELYIDQSKYTSKIIIKYNKLDLLPVLTPVELGVQLIKSLNQYREDRIRGLKISGLKLVKAEVR